MSLEECKSNDLYCLTRFESGLSSREVRLLKTSYRIVVSILSLYTVQLQCMSKQSKHMSKQNCGGLYPAPQIPAGICWNDRILAGSGRIIFGRGPSQICHSGDNLFRRNRAIPELTPECSPECTGTECYRNPVPGIYI